MCQAYAKYSSDGWFANFTHVFGHNPLLWLLPISTLSHERLCDGTYCDLDVFTNPPIALLKVQQFLAIDGQSEVDQRKLDPRTECDAYSEAFKRDLAKLASAPKNFTGASRGGASQPTLDSI